MSAMSPVSSRIISTTHCIETIDGEGDVRAHEFDKTLTMVALMLLNGSLIRDSLGSGGDQGDDVLECFAKEAGI